MTLSELPNHDNIVRGARQYFRSVRDEYRFQNTPAGPVKRTQKNLRNNRRNRRKRVSSCFDGLNQHLQSLLQKANHLRRQIPAFRAVYGDEKTVGLEEVILTDYMSSEHSDPGVVPVEEYRKYQRQNGGGSTGLEIRKEEWRSTWVRK
jgi:hypothetical protein